MARVLLKFNEAVLKEIQLDQPQLTIGRKSDNDLPIDNLAVSGHHARIVQEKGAYFIEDTASTNGTFLNEQRIQRHQLHNGDQIKIGKHLLVFQEELTRPATPAPSKDSDFEKTMVIPTQKQREAAKASASAAGTAEPPAKVGVLRIVSGQTDRKDYQLTGRVSIVGAQESATVRLTGWFSPKVGALISRRQDSYSISMSEEAKKILLNGTPIQGRADLKDGDLLEIAGVKMYFYLKEHLR